MFFRRPLFYFAPDAENGAAVDDVPVDGAESGEITDAEAATVDGVESGEDAAVGDSTAPAGDSLAGRVADLSEVWKQHGLSDLPTDPRQLASQYQAGLRAQQEAEQYKNQLLWNLHQQNQQRQVPATPPPPAAKVFDLPEFNQEWLNMVYTNEAGELVAKNGADPSLPQKIQAFARAKEAAQLKFLQDPMGVLTQHLQPWVQQQAQQIAEYNVREYNRQREINQFERENAGWVYNDGANPQSGLTPAAQRFNQYYHEAQQIRHPNPTQYAQRMLNSDAYEFTLQEQTQQQTQAAVVTTAKQADKNFLKTRAAHQANRGGSLPSRTTPKPPQNGKDPWGTLRKQIAALPPGSLDEK